jgi:hypothetical protein
MFLPSAQAHIISKSRQFACSKSRQFVLIAQVCNPQNDGIVHRKKRIDELENLSLLKI